MLVKWPSDNDAISETYKTKGELFQFYKVNEVANFATFAVCAKDFSELYCSNVFFE